MIVHAGVDISARWFDICVLVDEQPTHRRFENSSLGMSECVRWIESMNVDRLEIALEPTGRYGEAIAEYFYRRKHRVVQVNTLKFSRFAESLDIRGKSDHKDALALAIYSKERGRSVADWLPKTEVQSELRDMQVLLRSLTKRKVVLENQLKCKLRSTFVEQQLRTELPHVEQLLDECVTRCESLIKAENQLARDYELLLSIPGIGRKSAVLLLTVIDFRAFPTSRALACFLGLTKRKSQSGETIRGHEGISKRGNKWVRAELFMPARAARQFNPTIRAFAERLSSKGKHDWVIQAAVIRKLVTMAWAVIVKQQPYSAAHSSTSPI